MTVTNQTPEITVLTDGNNYTLDLGGIKKGLSRTAIFQIEEAEYANSFVSCGSCTKVTYNQQGQSLTVNITYTALGVKGAVNKTATVQLKDGTKLVFKIQGRIV